jgi:hypothetical protein
VIQLDPSDQDELSFALLKAVRRSGLTLTEIADRLEKDYGVVLSPSGVSHAVNRGTIRFQRAVQILAVCGVKEVKIGN